MTDVNICMRIYNDALAIEPTDGTVEAREYGLEIARESLDWSEDNNCGLDISTNGSVDFVCSKRFLCPLKGIVDIYI
jgi:hypothetical protein